MESSYSQKNQFPTATQASSTCRIKCAGHSTRIQNPLDRHLGLRALQNPGADQVSHFLFVLASSDAAPAFSQLHAHFKKNPLESVDRGKSLCFIRRIAISLIVIRKSSEFRTVANHHPSQFL
jgi:hypothetical protein